MGDYGIKIAKAGYAYDDGDKRLVLNTAYPFLKIKAHGTGTLTLSGGSGNKTVYTHSLNYKPMYYLWVNYLNTNGTEIEKLRLTSWRDYLGLGAWSYYHSNSTTTTITLDVYTGFSGSETLDYIYVVYYDSIT